MPDLTLITPEGRSVVAATTNGDRVRVDPEAVADCLGWHLRDEGLCRGDVCVPVADRASLCDEDGVDLQVLAEVLGLPLALDVQAGAAAVGTPHQERAATLAGAEAPDFALPDTSGRIHRLSDYRGKKVLLVAYASW